MDTNDDEITILDPNEDEVADMDESKVSLAIKMVESYSRGQTTLIDTFNNWTEVYDFLRQEKMWLRSRKEYILTYFCSSRRKQNNSIKCSYRIFVVLMPQKRFRVYENGISSSVQYQ